MSRSQDVSVRQENSAAKWSKKFRIENADHPREFSSVSLQGTKKTYSIDYTTVGTRNKEQVSKHRIIPYCESFPYCESSSFIKLIFGQHQHSVIASFY